MAAQYKGILNIFEFPDLQPCVLCRTEFWFISGSSLSISRLILGTAGIVFLCVQSHAKDSHKYFNDMHLGSSPSISNNCSSKVELHQSCSVLDLPNSFLILLFVRRVQKQNLLGKD